jgi:hypothetical protein
MKKKYKQIFSDLKIWSSREDSFSIPNFCQLKKIDYSELTSIANKDKNFTRIIKNVEEKLFENVKWAWSRNEISRTRVCECLKSYGYDNDNFEEIIKEMEESECDDLDKKMKEIEADPGAAFESAIKFLNKYGSSRGYVVSLIGDMELND